MLCDALFAFEKTPARVEGVKKTRLNRELGWWIDNLRMPKTGLACGPPMENVDKPAGGHHLRQNRKPKFQKIEHREFRGA
jgi:hypothetical protein